MATSQAVGEVSPGHPGAMSVMRKSRNTLTRRILRQKGIVIGGVVMLLMILVAISAPVIATHNPTLLSGAERLRPPTAYHFFGTDAQGRDVYSRVVYGSQLSLTVGFAVSLTTVIVGTILGLLCGYYQRVDSVVMRLMDGMMAFPGIILAIGIMAVRGAQVSNVILALSVVYTPRLTRVVRSIVLSLRDMQFVEAANAIGNPSGRILWRHILPNCLSPLIVQASFIFAEAVLGEATLSFLGAGAPPEVPSWGSMLNDSKNILQQAPWTMIFPGAAITLTVFALNLLGDGLRDLLDPRLRRL